tara:strand:+ start:1400 stop:1588 length:189 start_codon:yes stop_codon:yes gene_type:complete
LATGIDLIAKPAVKNCMELAKPGCHCMKKSKKEIFCFNPDSLQRNEKVEKLLAVIRLARFAF